ncbi:MAG: hypothetical protein E7073_07145 [Bacteroidales bacterium]|jgi:hypothetical protein|nr:hypothetical protein [Bacteroidales bacterium]
MKQKLILALFMLSLGIISAQAQGAGLSQGEAVKAQTPTTTKAKKTCPNCGITMGNITYPWQHESWCPHYRSQGGGSSSSRSSSSSSSSYTAASAATTALGALLSGWVAESFSKKTTPSPIRQKQEAQQKKLKEEVNYARCMYIQSMLADEKFWEVGDYAVVQGTYKYEGRQAFGIINKKTGKYVLDPNKKEYEDGDFGLQRRLHLGKRIVDVDDKHFLWAQIRLLPPPEGDPSGKPFVFIKFTKKFDKKDKIWSVDTHDWFQITDDDNLEPLDNSGYSVSQKYDLKLSEKNFNLIVKRGGKVGYYELFNDDNYSYNPISGNAESVTSTTLYSKVLIPIQYDSIVSIGDARRAFMGKEYDLYLYNFKDFTKAPDAMKQFETLEIRRIGKNIMYIASINGRYGLVNSKGEIILPLVYGKETKFIEYYKTISYTLWYEQEASKYIDKKGEFEKTDHFEARMKDAKMQEDYLREVMADAPQRYLAEKVPNKENLKLTLGEYDADKECFPISLAIAPWNIFMLPVPIADAKEFKTEFESIKASATKTAQLGIRYDAPSIETITFTTNGRKVYKYGE